jgi:ligand-binding sensor domain-containing protein
MIDHQGQKWIQMRYTNLNPYSVLVFTDNGTPDNPGDDQYKKLNSTVGNGNIPGNIVFAMATDRNGEVWVGTEKGVAVFYSPENIFSGKNFDAQRILVEQGGYVQYLLENETVTAIAIDGANRKWIGTDRGGVYLFSEDGTKQIYHFTQETSPLLSNRVTSIALNNITGEVYFATDNGVISFKSTATEGGDTFGDVYAYPNPVRADYEGYIAIKGLVNNAQVRITDISGLLIYSTKAEGGQAVWDGKNFDGRRARTGVYLVFAATEDGSEKIVTKILIVH